MGLFPFPRVGRSDPGMISEWESPLSYNSLENYDGNYPCHPVKLSNLLFVCLSTGCKNCVKN